MRGMSSSEVIRKRQREILDLGDLYSFVGVLCVITYVVVACLTL